MLIMVSLTLDEVVAMIEFLVLARREGQSIWDVFWSGGTLSDKTAVSAVTVRPDAATAQAMVWGGTVPRNLLVSIGLGVWLMFAPSALGSAAPAAHSDHVVGALIVTVATIALADVGRMLRYLDVLLGAWVVISPWLVDGATRPAMWNDVLVGISVVLLSVRRGPIRERYGRFQRCIR